MHYRKSSSIGIACIETKNHDRAVKAVLHTLAVCKGLPVNRLYWFSDQPFPKQTEIEYVWGPNFLVWIEIPHFDSNKSFNEQLNLLTLDLLPKTIETDFCLTVQADGYAANPNAWTDAFFDYDYIGASWPQEQVGRDVGNGGFSWRSKKLYQAILDLRSKYSIEDLTANTNSDETWVDKFGWRSIPEDNLVCKVYRPILEREYGILFAPVEIADRFSIEAKSDSSWLSKSFGFHGHIVGSFYKKLKL